MFYNVGIWRLDFKLKSKFWFELITKVSVKSVQSKKSISSMGSTETLIYTFPT